MFLNSVNIEGEVKNRHYIAEKLEDYIREVGTQNVIQIITNNACACKVAGVLWSASILTSFGLLV